MKALPIDFAPPSLQRSLRRVHPLAWLLLCTALLLGLALWQNAQKLRAQQQQQQLLLERQQNRLLARTPTQTVTPKAEIAEPKANAINAAIGQLNLPWHGLLNALEAATPKTIALLAIEPDAKKQALKGQAEAKDSDDMLDYLEQLKKQPFFDQVDLTKHEINEQDPNKPLRFQFEAHWSGEKP
jgi:Tfp pilus assembly protein PilN